MLVLGEIVGWEALLVVAIVALLFGSAKIPQLARSLGQASHEFRKGAEEGSAPEAPPTAESRPEEARPNGTSTGGTSTDA